MENKAKRKLTVCIKRSKGGVRFYQVDEKPRMSVLILLKDIQEEYLPDLYFESVCGSAICGSCAIKINGQPKLVCKTQTSSLPDVIKLEPLDFFPIIKDLATDKSVFFEKLNRRLEAWVHRKNLFNSEEEGRMSDELASKLYANERCIECGICVSACVAASFGKFISAGGILKGLRFGMDPRNEDPKAVDELINILASNEGLWGCHGIEACENFCPKEIPLTRQLASARKEFLKLIFKNNFSKFGNMFRKKK